MVKQRIRMLLDKARYEVGE